MNVIDMSLVPKTPMCSSFSSLFERLAVVVEDTPEDTQDRFWTLFDRLLEDKAQHLEKVIRYCTRVLVLVVLIKSNCFQTRIIRERWVHRKIIVL